MEKLPYRADIDGLRALAVILVALFHTLPEYFSGGFIGVDVFFVISGFLITGIIEKSLMNANFSFFTFYMRRINRIFPALIIVMIFVYIFGWNLLFPPELKQLSVHLFAGSLFSANFAFWYEAGYFDNIASTKPLLHLWSLGIEEQFYLVWPFLIWLGYKAQLRTVWLAAIIILSSFALNVVLVTIAANVADFYSPLTRAWQLMSGALLVFIPERKLTGHVANIVSSFSLAALVIFAICGNAVHGYPGWWALVPTIATTAIIAVGDQAWTNRKLLANRTMVTLGLASYPIYLWHWPVLSFVRIVNGEAPPALVRIVAAALGTALGFLTYAIVEAPFRRGWGPLKARAALLTAGIAAVSAIAVTTRVAGGLPSRPINQSVAVNTGELGHDFYFRYLVDHSYPCTPESLRKEAISVGYATRCYQSRPSEKKNIAIIGDSHAEDLYLGLAENLDKNVVAYIKGQGMPFLSNPELTSIFDFVSHDSGITTVIIASAWTTRMRMGQADSIGDLEKKVYRATSYLVEAGKKVYLVDDRPLFPFSPRVCKYSSTGFWRKTVSCQMEHEDFKTQQKEYSEILNRIASRLSNVKVMATEGAFCAGRYCDMARNGVLFYRDGDHLTYQGSEQLGRYLVAEYPEIKD